ncbi:hypothetical protein PPTG_21896 [Phytophthora nicotianae INRA-310]|uniref:Uncharacterized protein n=4 Tax=Phytophthora nicotianae TaxID=4792 RepID=W2QVQ0_PHYN3|nr:hypothetical protein PPTG_21896 [Phytophthora nicotianae INRA-310]ETN16315.1 hypothetical protein PPTG_21896 [Phytophthora nicotianae INRA-310]
MNRKRKRDDYPGDWDVVEETQDPDKWFCDGVTQHLVQRKFISYRVYKL